MHARVHGATRQKSVILSKEIAVFQHFNTFANRLFVCCRQRDCFLTGSVIIVAYILLRYRSNGRYVILKTCIPRPI